MLHVRAWKGSIIYQCTCKSGGTYGRIRFGPLDHDAPYKRPKIIDEDEDDVLNGKGTDGKSLADKAMAKLKPRKEDIFRRALFAFHDKGDDMLKK